MESKRSSNQNNKNNKNSQTNQSRQTRQNTQTNQNNRKKIKTDRSELDTMEKTESNKKLRVESSRDQDRTNMRNITYLVNNEYENLNWTGPFNYPNMVRIRTPTDGSCFFHAIAKSYFEPYILGKLNNAPFDRREFIKKLRKDLSLKLKSRVDPTNPNNQLIYYDTLSRGDLAEFAKSVPVYSLENMVKELDSDHAVDNVYNEFISDQLNKDIYILDMVKKDVYITGQDNDILYKDRKSIVILYLPGHYELVGLDENGIVKTLFDPNHPFIRYIQDRMESINKNNQDRIDRKD